MTGFGLGKAQSAQSQIEVSLRTVNGRFFETRFHLPREFIFIESELKKMLQKYIDRGTIDIFVSRKIKPGSTQLEISVNKKLVQQYLSAYKMIAKEMKTKPIFHVEALARMPDVIQSQEENGIDPEEQKALLAAMEKACEAIDKERHREGKSLKNDLEMILNDLEKEVQGINSVREEANQSLMSRFEQKMKTRLSGLEIDSSRISQEIVIQLEKADINEELSRLKEHIQNYRSLLSEKIPIGKKLDFYTQELLREVNTIGSKSSLSKLTQIVVQAKTLIERLREQVQNVE